jgi:hypothetical protein
VLALLGDLPAWRTLEAGVPDGSRPPRGGTLEPVTDYADVPVAVLTGLRSVCLGLPDVVEEQAWAGTRWRVRTRTFAHVLTLDSPAGPSTVMTFRSSGPELDVLFSTGHPFFRAGWGTNVVGMVLDADVDWDEVAELVTDSYCVLAPKKLVALVDRPGDPPPG